MASIVVVGGGVAGLTCAWRLRRAGHDVEVLEREARPGGRMRTEEQAGFRLDRGAQFVADAYRNLLATARALGLDERLRPLARQDGSVLRAGRLHADPTGAPARLLGSTLLSAGARLRLLRVGLDLLRQRRRLDPWHPEAAAVLDHEDLARALRRRVGEEALEFLFAPAFSATFDCEPEDLSWAFGLLVLRLFGAGFRLRSFEGGAGLLTRTLAEQVPLRTGCDVVSVETETDGARVRYRTGGRLRSVFADAAVVALPGCAVAGVCPKLTPDERGFLEGVRYGRGIIVHLLLERPVASFPGYAVAFPRREGLDLYGVCADHHKPGAAPAGAGLLNAALTERAAARLWEAPDAEVERAAVDALARTPLGRVAPVGAAVHRWDALLPRFEVGYLPRLRRFLARIERSPRLAFAGDYLVGPTTEGALTSGMRAAHEVSAAV